ncbi:MAG: hypothetical protein ACK53Y_25285, partial [bacterium]
CSSRVKSTKMVCPHRQHAQEFGCWREQKRTGVERQKRCPVGASSKRTGLQARSGLILPPELW